LPKVYIGQTGRSLNTRYKKDIQSIKYNRENSGYAIHILNNAHCYGTTEDVMEIIEYAKKKNGRMLNISRIFLKYGHFSYDGVNDQHMFTKQRCIAYYYITTGSGKLPYCPRYIARGQAAKKTL
jgi:hypothetical protein